jgi:hypothetical protein
MMAITWHVANPPGSSGGLQYPEHGDDVHVSYIIPGTM